MGRRRLIAGFVLAASGATLFASKAILVKLAYVERPDPLLMLVWRMIFALPFFAVLVGAGIVRMTERVPTAAVGLTVLLVALEVGWAWHRTPPQIGRAHV